jgi:hypothetical protein
MTVDFMSRLDGDLAEDAWKLYYDCFAPLAIEAVQQHVMTRTQLDEVASDERVSKVLTRNDDGELVGLATFTNDLDAVPLISPAYFEHHWPELYAQRRIWYIGFVAVAEQARKSGAFIEAFGHYFRTAYDGNGIVGLDVCTYNEDVHHLPQIIGLQVRRLSGGASTYRRLDAQSYWFYDMRGEHL